jgi:hypothetical protein
MNGHQCPIDSPKDLLAAPTVSCPHVHHLEIECLATLWCHAVNDAA